jgi:transposase
MTVSSALLRTPVLIHEAVGAEDDRSPDSYTITRWSPMSTLFVGLDLSLASVTGAFRLDDASKPAKGISFANNREGSDLLVKKILDLTGKLGVSDVQIGMEATGNFWVGICDFLREHPELAPLNLAVHSLNARQVANVKKLFPEKPKTDPIDAAMIAEFMRFRRLPDPILPDKRYLALREMTRYRFHMAQTLAEHKNRFLSEVFLKFPGFRQDKPLSNTFGSASSALLTEFLTLDEIVAMKVEDLAAFLMEKGKNHFTDPEAVAKAIQRAAKHSYRIDKHMVDSVNTVLAMMLDVIQYLERQIAAADKVIAKMVDALGNSAKVLLSVKGIGPVFCAGIIAELGDINRFHSDAAVAKFASIVWTKSQSGDFVGDDTHMMRSGNKYLRYYLIEAANSLRMHNEEYRAYYQSKFREATTHITRGPACSRRVSL